MRTGRRVLLLGLVVAAVTTGVVGGLWASPSEAAPAAPTSPAREAQGADCQEIARSRWTMPDEIGPENEVTGEREDPSAYEGRTAGDVDPEYLITYCDPDGDGVWTKEDDPFPYDEDDLCVRIYRDPAEQDEYENTEPPADSGGGAAAGAPAEIPEVTAIDIYGELDPAGADVVVDDDTVRYCRSDEGWVRDDSDASTGYYEEWAEECAVVVAPDDGDPPERLSSPGNRGHVIREAHPDDDDVNMVELAEELEDEQGITDIEFGDLEMYCTDEEGEDWYWVEGASLEEMLPGYSGWTQDWDNPNEGTCVVMYDDGDPIDDLPEVLAEGERPPEYGTALPMAMANIGFGVEEDYELSNMLCFDAGRWRRGDDLTDGCDGQFVQVFTTWMETGGGFLPAECWGTFPTPNYDIGYHSGDWNDFQPKVTGWFMHTGFNFGAGVMQVAQFSVDEAYDFDIFDYENLGRDLAVDFRLNLTENDAFDLVGWCWLFLWGFVFVNILRRRAALAIGELVMSVALMVLSAALIANYADYMRSAWNFMDEATVAMLLVGHGEDPAAPDNSDVTVDEVIDTIQHDLHRIFIEEPYDLINWGRHFEPADPCGTTRNEILALGPHGDDGEPRHMMEDAGCNEEAAFNSDPTGTRLLTSFMAAGASVLGGVMLISGASTVVAAQFASMLLFGVGPVAMLTGRLPGGGRRLFWLWLAVLCQVLAVVVIVAIVLALLLRVMLVAEGAIGEDASMVERFAIMLLLVWLVEMMRRRFLQAAQSSAGRWADNMTNFRAGGGGGGSGGGAWQGPSGSRGLYVGGQGHAGRAIARTAVVGALGTAAAGRMAAVVGRGSAVPFRLAGRSFVKRRDERRVAGRSIANLVNRAIVMDGGDPHTPSSTKGLKRAVRQLRRRPGTGHGHSRPGSALGRGGAPVVATATPRGRVSLAGGGRLTKMYNRSAARPAGRRDTWRERRRELLDARTGGRGGLRDRAREWYRRPESRRPGWRRARAEDRHVVEVNYERQMAGMPRRDVAGRVAARQRRGQELRAVDRRWRRRGGGGGGQGGGGGAPAGAVPSTPGGGSYAGPRGATVPTLDGGSYAGPRGVTTPMPAGPGGGTRGDARRREAAGAGGGLTDEDRAYIDGMAARYTRHLGSTGPARSSASTGGSHSSSAASRGSTPSAPPASARPGYELREFGSADAAASGQREAGDAIYRTSDGRWFVERRRTDD
jgi:hypothetical protein